MILGADRLRPIIQEFLKVCERYYDNCQIVQRPLYRCLLYYGISHGTTDLVYRFRCLCRLLDLIWLDRVDAVPTCVEYLLISQPVEDAITAQHNEVVELVLYCELRDLRLSYNHAFLATILGMLGLDITEGARDWEPARYHAMRPQDELLLWLSIAVKDILNGLCLVNATTVLDDSLYLIVLIGAMISR